MILQYRLEVLTHRDEAIPRLSAGCGQASTTLEKESLCGITEVLFAPVNLSQERTGVLGPWLFCLCPAEMKGIDFGERRVLFFVFSFGKIYLCCGTFSLKCNKQIHASLKVLC